MLQDVEVGVWLSNIFLDSFLRRTNLVIIPLKYFQLFLELAVEQEAQLILRDSLNLLFRPLLLA